MARQRAKRIPGKARRPEVADGKRRLIEAGLRLGARGRSLPSLGLRELAREAGLNPNTFYRHFADMEELGLAAVEEVTRQLRLGLKEIRSGTGKREDTVRGSAEYFLEFARRNQEVFAFGLHELHGGSQAMRRALRRAMDEIATEIADDLHSGGLAPTDDRDVLLEITTAMVDLMFHRSMDYVERPGERRAIIDRAVRLTRMLFLGSAALAVAPSRPARGS